MKNFENIFNNEKRNTSREGDFKRRDSGKKRFGGGDRDRGRPQMYDAVCSDCGRKCQVPFRPSNDKPVYCSECFTNHGAGQSSGRSEGRGYDRPSFQDKKMFDATCDKCGKRFELPFRPTGEKPVYCSNCFDRSGNTLSKSNDKGSDQYKEQFDIINAKLDRIIKSLFPAVIEKAEKKEIIVEKKEVAPAKKETVTTKKEVISVKKETAKKEKIKKEVIVAKKEKAKSPKKVAVKKSAVKNKKAKK